MSPAKITTALRRFLGLTRPSPIKSSNSQSNAYRFRIAVEQLETREVPANFVVNSTSDNPDANPGTGTAWTGVVLANGQNEVTLRSAITEANAVGNAIQASTITFALPPTPVAVADGDGPPPTPPPPTIGLTRPLDNIRVSLNINGGDPNALTITSAQGVSCPFFTIATNQGDVTTIAVEFDNLTISGARAQSDAGAPAAGTWSSTT